jgi:hypothetical protein
MKTAKPIPKVVSLRVRASQASHLCFEVGGILGELGTGGQRTELGAQVVAFDFPGFYLTLMNFDTVPLPDPSRLIYDSFQIRNNAEPFLLAALRAEDRKAALNKAINARQNAYKAKYINIPAVVSRMLGDYGLSSSGSKPRRLKNLRDLSQQQADLLSEAYNSEGRTGVVKTTDSKLNSCLESKGSSNLTGNKVGQRGASNDSRTAHGFVPDIQLLPPLQTRR